MREHYRSKLESENTRGVPYITVLTVAESIDEAVSIACDIAVMHEVIAKESDNPLDEKTAITTFNN